MVNVISGTVGFVVIIAGTVVCGLILFVLVVATEVVFDVCGFVGFAVGLVDDCLSVCVVVEAVVVVMDASVVD